MPLTTPKYKSSPSSCLVGLYLSVKGQAPILAAVVMFAFTFSSVDDATAKAELLMVMAAMLLGGLFVVFWF